MCLKETDERGRKQNTTNALRLKEEVVDQLFVAQKLCTGSTYYRRENAKIFLK